jgi:hypothetical protein
VTAILEHAYTATCFRVYAPDLHLQFIVTLLHLYATKLDEKFGRIAHTFLSDRYLQANVRLTVAFIDKVGRFTSTAVAVFGDGREFDIALTLLEEGLAELRPGTPPPAYVEAEAGARLQRRGVWSDKTRRPRVLQSPERVRVLRVDDASHLTVAVIGGGPAVAQVLARATGRPLGRKPVVGECVVVAVGGGGGGSVLARARVEESADSETVVNLIDIGEVTTVELEALQEPPEEVLDLEPLAVDVALAFVDAAADEIDADVICARELWAQVVGEAEGRPAVLLSENQGDEWNTVNMQMLRNGDGVLAECRIAAGYERVRKRFVEALRE